jgi:hypothetical protein
MPLPGVLGGWMHTRRDVIPNHPRIEEAIVHAQSQLPILFGHKHDRRRKGRDIMAKNSGIQHDLRRPLQLRLMMRSSRVAPASDGLHARLYPLGSPAGVRPQLVDCSSGCSRKKEQSAAVQSSSSTPRSESSEQAEASSASTLPALERLRRRCPGPSAEHSLLPFCLARPRSPRRYRSLPFNLF